MKFDFSARKAQLEAIIKSAEGIKDRKSTERKAAARASRKLRQISAIEELLKNLAEGSKLSEDTTEYISTLTEEYTPGTSIDVQEGDNLIELLEEYKDVKDLYKKILKQCEKKGLQIKGTEIIKQ